jgi:hypothetical protein
MEQDKAESVFRQYQEVAVRVGGLVWFRPPDALRVLETGETEGIELLGFDGTFVEPSSITPSLADSWDYNSRTAWPKVDDPYEHARQFITDRLESGLCFEIVLASD